MSKPISMPLLNARERNNIATRAYYARNKEARLEYHRNHVKANPEKRRETVRKWKAKKRLEDPFFFVKENCRTRISAHLRATGLRKKNKSLTMIGCSPHQLKLHLASLFTEGMSWDNYGKWHVDHIIPISSATNVEQLEKLCHWTNLQPLWAGENSAKGDRLIQRPKNDYQK